MITLTLKPQKPNPDRQGSSRDRKCSGEVGVLYRVSTVFRSWVRSQTLPTVGSAVGSVVGSDIGSAVGSAVESAVGSAIDSTVDSAVGSAFGGCRGTVAAWEGTALALAQTWRRRSPAPSLLWFRLFGGLITVFRLCG